MDLSADHHHQIEPAIETYYCVCFYSQYRDNIGHVNLRFVLTSLSRNL
jgi:hypothetical protein